MEEKTTNTTPEIVLKGSIKELLGKMGFDVEVEVSKQEDGENLSYLCNITTDESNFLIGQYGVNLQALQHLVRILVRKKIEDKVNFILDVNSYRKEKNDSLLKMATTLAEEAVTEKRAVVMRPMSAYERRIVHLELSKNNQVVTESIGEGEDRRIVIKPANLL